MTAQSVRRYLSRICRLSSKQRVLFGLILEHMIAPFFVVLQRSQGVLMLLDIPPLPSCFAALDVVLQIGNLHVDGELITRESYLRNIVIIGHRMLVMGGQADSFYHLVGISIGTKIVERSRGVLDYCINLK